MKKIDISTLSSYLLMLVKDKTANPAGYKLLHMTIMGNEFDNEKNKVPTEITIECTDPANGGTFAIDSNEDALYILPRVLPGIEEDDCAYYDIPYNTLIEALLQLEILNISF